MPEQPVIDGAPANDNPVEQPSAISFTDLAKALGLDEDTLMERFAHVLLKRKAGSDDQ